MEGRRINGHHRAKGGRDRNNHVRSWKGSCGDEREMAAGLLSLMATRFSN